MNIILGMKILCMFFGVIRNWAIFQGHFYAFKGLFLRSSSIIGDIFGMSKISNILRVA